MIHWIAYLVPAVALVLIVWGTLVRRKPAVPMKVPVIPPVVAEEASPKRKKVPLQVLLRIIDEDGNLHVIRRGPGPGRDNNGWLYVMEGHWGQPESWRKTMPSYYMPITQEELIEEYRKQGKEWIPEEQSWD